jgi:hypothetical protein
MAEGFEVLDAIKRGDAMIGVKNEPR